MRPVRPLFPAGVFFREAVFRIGTSEKMLYLTFDDGPDPGSTPAILEILAKNKICTLFFCNGDKAEKHPELISEIRKGGHITGNHGYHHINGWKSNLIEYCENVNRAAPLTSRKLFRPPYGRLSIRQYLKLRKEYTIWFWDLMCYDFDKEISAEKSLEILKTNIRPGSVIVLHDTPDSSSLFFLDDFIAFCKTRNYNFGTFLNSL